MPYPTINNGESGLVVRGKLNTALAAVREVLTADRTYYVRTDGNDANTGLANTAGGAFLTLQHAYDVIAATLDLGGYNITIQVGNGTYSAGVVGKRCVGQASTDSILFLGDSATPGNVIIDRTSGPCFLAGAPGIMFRIQGFKLITDDDAGLTVINQGIISFLDIDFGACVFAHIYADTGGIINQRGEYEISAGTAYHLLIDLGGAFSGLFGSAQTVTVTGTPNFSGAFAFAGSISLLAILGVTYSGAATGIRFDANTNGVIQTFGAGANFFPGDTPGTTSQGGIYA